MFVVVDIMVIPELGELEEEELTAEVAAPPRSAILSTASSSKASHL